jgi:hypothetical protein
MVVMILVELVDRIGCACGVGGDSGDGGADVVYDGAGTVDSVGNSSSVNGNNYKTDTAFGSKERNYGVQRIYRTRDYRCGDARRKCNICM